MGNGKSRLAPRGFVEITVEIARGNDIKLLVLKALGAASIFSAASSVRHTCELSNVRKNQTLATLNGEASKVLEYQGSVHFSGRGYVVTLGGVSLPIYLLGRRPWTL